MRGPKIYFNWNSNPFLWGPNLHRIIYTRTENLRDKKILLGFGLMIAIIRSVKILRTLYKSRTLIGETDTLYTETVLYILESYTFVGEVGHKILNSWTKNNNY